MKIIIAKSLSAVGLVAASGAAFAANTGILSAMPDSTQSLADAIGQTADANDPNQSTEQAIPVEVTESESSSNPFQAFIEVFTGDNDDDSNAVKDVDWNAVSPTRPAATPSTTPTSEPSNSVSPETKEEPSDEPTYSNGGSNGETAARPARPTPTITESGGSETASGSSGSSSTTSGGSASSGDDDDDDDHDGDDHDDDDDDDDEDEDDD